MLSYFEFVWKLFNNHAFLIVGAWLGLPITIALIVLFARKKNRDERGWKIIGKASVISFIYFIIMANVIAKTVGNRLFCYELNYIFYANTIQWLYDTVILIEIGAILFLRKIE